VLEASGTPVLYEAERRFSTSVDVLHPDEDAMELWVHITDTRPPRLLCATRDRCRTFKWQVHPPSHVGLR
jgi:hypothetical protein